MMSSSCLHWSTVSSVSFAMFLLLQLPQLVSIDAFAPSRSPKSSSSFPYSTTALGLRVAYQGVPGAYSEKSTRELLGDNVIAIGRPDFESCFQAVASMEVDYACLPIENSLGGSIHENYDLMLRYDLTICAEHEFRVQHCVLAKEGVKLEDIKYAISHPQALAQCDNYLRGLGIRPIPTYDTAGSAKMIIENDLPDNCTPENTCAIASDLAGRTYGMNCLAKGVEDDDSNFTRFLLLGRKGVLQFLTQNVPAKTSVVFTLPNTAGALYKALACFSLRDIDFSKIESRPTSVSLLNYLKFRSQQKNNGSGKNKREELSVPRFRYCFYLDFLEGQLSSNSENALANLREFTDYVRILGSYPRGSRLVGPVATAVEELKTTVVDDPRDVSLLELPSDSDDGSTPLKIGILGFGSFGQFLAARMSQKHRVSCLDKLDKTVMARNLGVDFYPHFEMSNFLKDLDVVVLSVPMIDLEETVEMLPVDNLSGKLVVDVSPLNQHPKNILLQAFANHPDIDVLVTNPMFGPTPQRRGTVGVAASVINGSSGDVILSPSNAASLAEAANSLWEGRPIVYERARISNIQRCDRYLKIFEKARCQVVEMNSDQHDATTADAEFVTHMVGRLLDQDMLPPTPVMSKEYEALYDVAEMTSGDSFDFFFGMFKNNPRAKEHLSAMRENLASLERQLAAREAYLMAKDEMRKSDRQRLLAETRLLLQELARNGIADETAGMKKSSPPQISSLDTSQHDSSSSSSIELQDSNP
ncbi:prephenate dehydratase [Nitzschia inconspicua]|uniref:Prephenate dehydratase n=1 Tax=Nitzschia inconspicua TaxID=303405 RepID=A0A9K3Q1G9_9STRA|nr:prephenate dehydratase [Nitzschia inconspicua]